MRNILAVGAVLCAASLVHTTAHAEYYRQYWGPALRDGDTATNYWHVVLGSVPREVVPGKADRTWCDINFAGGSHHGFFGNSVSYEVLEAPKLGQLRTFATRLSYRGAQVGHDRIVLKKHWLSSRDNKPMTGTQTIEIEVVDHAL